MTDQCLGFFSFQGMKTYIPTYFIYIVSLPREADLVYIVCGMHAWMLCNPSTTSPSSWFLFSPRLALQVFQKLQEAEVTAQEIEKLREGYRPAARRGALLFFVLAEMAAVNFMYQYSLNAYLGVFGYSLKKSLPDSHLAKRLRNIIDTLTYNVYVYACTGEPQCSACCICGVFLLRVMDAVRLTAIDGCETCLLCLGGSWVGGLVQGGL